MKEYTYQGVKFELDDSGECYIKVMYDKMPHLVGYAGVTHKDLLHSSRYVNFLLAHEYAKERITPDGRIRGFGGFDTIEAAIVGICQDFIEAFANRDVDYGKLLKEKLEESCEDLHKFFADLKS